MKVFFIGSYDSSDIVPAPVKVAKNLFENLKVHLQDIKFITYFEDGSIYSRRQKLFGKEILSGSIYRMGIFPLIIFIIKNKPDIIHLTNAAAFYLVVFLLKPFSGFKVIYTFHSIIKYNLKYYNNFNTRLRYRFLLIEKIVSKYSDCLFVLNKNDKQYVQQYYSVPPGQIVVIDNGVADMPFKKKYYNNNGETKIIFVGDWSKKEKGFDILLESLAKINKNFLLTVCYGSGTKKYNASFPSNVEVKFRSALNELELRKEFVKNDIMIVPSRYESYGLALLEAMNSGLLFICFDSVGLAERLPEELRLFVVPQNEQLKMGEKISFVINLSNEEKNLFSKRIIDFSNRCTWSEIAKDYFKKYQNVIK